MALRMTSALVAAAWLSACTDRMEASSDPWSRTGELIAQSGGEGGARYACVTCHGTEGEGNGYDAPRLAGLPAGYLQKQMQDYAMDLRPHPVMRDVSKFLDSNARVRVSAFYAAMPPAAMPPATLESPPAGAERLYHQGDAARGLASCAGCHGDGGMGAAGGPPLSGQPAYYLARQLRDWQAGKRRNDGGQVMMQAAQLMTDREIEAISLYLARRPPALPGPDR